MKIIKFLKALFFPCRKFEIKNVSKPDENLKKLLKEQAEFLESVE